MTENSSKYLAPYIFNLLSLLAALPWLLFIGIFTIPSMLSALFSPPPGTYGLNPQIFDYTINTLMVTAIQLAPLLGLFFSGLLLFTPSSIKNLESNILASQILWLKSCIPLAGLLIAQWMFQRDIFGVLFAQPIQIAFYVVSPALGGLALLLGKQGNKTGPLI